MFWRTMGCWGVLLSGACALQAAHKSKLPREDSNTDRIAVVGHLELKDVTPCRLTLAEHWRRSYLYLENEQTTILTTVDVTDIKNPAIAGEVSRGSVPGAVRVMVGTVGLLQSPGETAPAIPKEITIVDFADAGKPQVLRHFANISGYAEAPGKALIFIVNTEGLWILKPQPGTDVELEKEYERHVIYDR